MVCFTFDKIKGYLVLYEDFLSKKMLLMFIFITVIAKNRSIPME